MFALTLALEMKRSASTTPVSDSEKFDCAPIEEMRDPKLCAMCYGGNNTEVNILVLLSWDAFAKLDLASGIK